MIDKKKLFSSIKEQIDLDLFLRDHTIKHKNEKKSISDKLQKVISNLIYEPEKIGKHIAFTIDFIKEIWKKYDREEIADFFIKFVRMEPTLLSIGRTRDHFLHIFHVYLFGLRIISQIIKLIPSNYKKILKVEDEHKDICVFPYQYNSTERIFYIWTLASTFHDIAYLFEYLPKIEDGMNDFADFCKFKISQLKFQLDYSDIIELNHYFKLISNLYGGKLEIIEFEKDKYTYKKQENPFLYKTLLYAFRERNHGVIGSIILFRLIEDMFLIPRRGAKYSLNAEQYNKYIKYYFKDDIVRMALIIALHHLKKGKIPSIPKIRFSEFPLIFVLIIADEFQEFIRRSIKLGEETILLKNLPKIKIQEKSGNLKLIITYILDSEEINKIKEKTTESDDKEALAKFWSNSTKTLEDRLFKEDEFQILLKIKHNSSILFKWALI